MQEVQVFEATRTAPNSRGRVRSNPITVERIRVAAYVRVSTDDDDQLGSFESQKLYYEEKIGENPEWVNAGIFADEAITGTKTDKRTGFQEMINRCLNGEIDLILTKSISRFARNTLDTLQYSRMLKDKNIGVIITDHNVQETLRITDRSYLLFDGRILKVGSAKELSEDELVRKVYLGKNFKLNE